METKHLVYIGAFVGGAIGSFVGSMLDGGNYFGLWGILLGGAGGIAGIWITYKFMNG